MTFEVISNYVPTGDQPKAISQLVKGLNDNQKYQTLLGVTGSGKTFTIANVLSQVNRPTLVLSHNKTLAAQLYAEFKSFFPNNLVEYYVSYYDYYQPEAYLPASNKYIEKDLSINAEIEKLRLASTTALLKGRKDVIIISSVSCIYGIGNPENFKENIITLKIGMTITRDKLLFQFVQAQYSRSRIGLERGEFRVKGDVIDIYLGYTDYAFRIIFWGNNIEEIKKIDPDSGFVVENLTEITIFPNRQFLTNREKLADILFTIQKDMVERVKFFENQGLHLEAKRIEDRVVQDIEMIKELGYCSGIENYSRYFDERKPGERPFCLIDYFPKDFILIVDESHVSLPQVRGMYEGDRVRKSNLIEYGFRLPSAFDNRPLKYDEFKQLHNQVIFVSATPEEEEIRLSEGVIVEQIIRPTGLLEPIIEIRPSIKQLDDLMKEIRLRANKNERILVTTLTKRMAEELTTFFIQNSIRVKYIHSEIDTMERVEILKELRLGSIDVLVGINLLREGLDLPEVSLVAILDADKEGFLRTEKSLTQTIGRAARNANGKVIMYADKITKSMQRTMDENERRRKIQFDYNKSHGITPKTIIKSKKEILDQKSILKNEYIEKSVEYETDLEYEKIIAAEPESEYYSEKAIINKIEELNKRMLLNAKDQNFIDAAKLRDQIFTLKALLKNEK